MFCAGDLIRVPSNVSLISLDYRDLIEKYKVTRSPKMGIFIKYKDTDQCVINTDGENWVVSVDYIRIMENRDDKINTNR